MDKLIRLAAGGALLAFTTIAVGNLQQSSYALERRKRKFEPIIKKHMSAHGMLSKGWTWSFGNNLRGSMLGDGHTPGKNVSAMAICDYYNKELVFDLSYFGFGGHDFEQTLIHEIAHYYNPDEGHSAVWLKKARSMGYTWKWRASEQQDEINLQTRRAREAERMRLLEKAKLEQKVNQNKWAKRLLIIGGTVTVAAVAYFAVFEPLIHLG